MTDDQLIDELINYSSGVLSRPEIDRLIALARIGAAAKSIDCAASIAFEIQMDQVRRRDQEKETSEEWQVYNHGVFIAGKIKDALAVLASPEQQEPK